VVSSLAGGVHGLSGAGCDRTAGGVGRYSAGDGVRAIARGIGVDRKTIAKYVAAAVAVGLSRGVPPPTEDQLAAFVRGLRGTPVGRRAALPERLAPYQAQIAAWLGDGLRLTKIHRRLREQGPRRPV
jgi:hypothetical protein